MTHFGWNINNISTDIIANIGSIRSMWPRSGNAFAIRRSPYYSRLAAGATGGWVDQGPGSLPVGFKSFYHASSYGFTSDLGALRFCTSDCLHVSIRGTSFCLFFSKLSKLLPEWLGLGVTVRLALG